MQGQRLKILLEFLEQEPDEPFNRYGVAMEYLKSEPQRACEHLEVLVQQHPNYLPSYYQLAQIYFNQDALEEAEVIYKKGITVAMAQKNDKIEKELRGAYQMLKDEMEE